MVTPVQQQLFDSADMILLRELQLDARQTNRSLANAANLAPSTTLARVRDLEQRKVISGYHAEVELTAIGRGLQALVFVRLQPKSQDLINAFLEHVWELPETIGIDLISGVEDAVIHLAVPDANALQDVIMNRISGYPGVFDERTSLLFEHRQKRVIEPL